MMSARNRRDFQRPRRLALEPAGGTATLKGTPSSLSSCRESQDLARLLCGPTRKNETPRARTGYRRHRTKHAYGCFLPDLTRFTVHPCTGPARARGVGGDYNREAGLLHMCRLVERDGGFIPRLWRA